MKPNRWLFLVELGTMDAYAFYFLLIRIADRYCGRYMCFITLINIVIFKLVIFVHQRGFLQSAVFRYFRGSFLSSGSPICGMLQVAADVKQYFPLICGKENQSHAKLLIVFMNVFIRRKQ